MVKWKNHHITYRTMEAIIWKDKIKADNKQEAIKIALRMNYKSGLGMKYMDNLEANTINVFVKEEEE